MKLGFVVKVTINGRVCIGEAIQPPVSEREFTEARRCWLYWIRQCQWEQNHYRRALDGAESAAA